MKKAFIVALALGLFLGLVSLTTAQADAIRDDGNWWITLNKQVKSYYTGGFLTGMNLGYNMSVWKILEDTPKGQCVAKVHESYGFHFDRYFKHVTNVQLAQGLDDFYSDYKNRRIQVWPAVWLVVNGIAGTPKEELDKMIEDFRKNANN